jgi:rhodanese-related sulfurtransferase
MAFRGAVRRDAAGTPFVSAEFLAEQGQHVRILDVREPAELGGPLGHIPAVTSVPLKTLGEVPAVLSADTLLVLVAGDSQLAGVGARYLEALGMGWVAALEGGMEAWKKLGFTTSREPTSVRTTLRPLPPGVGRNGRPLVAAQKGQHLSPQQIVDHVGDPGSVRWVKLAAFLLHGKRSCVDGRDDKGVIGTPGGDAGELILALAAVEALTGQALSEAQVAAVFEAHLDTFGRFYMHSDTHAMNHLIVEQLRKDPRITPFLTKVFEPTEWRAFYANPPQEVREALLEHLAQPAAMGCGHLRFVMTDPHYRVRPELVRSFLRAFHQARWAGSPEVEWVVLGGDHVEGAVLLVQVEGDLHAFTRIPLVSPQVDGLQLFVSHPQVTAYLRRETASFLVRCGLVPADQEGALLDALQALGDQHLGATLARLAAGLPLYRLTFCDRADVAPRLDVVGAVG